jgi:hypothetical protein
VTVGFSPNPATGATSTATFTASATATTGTFGDRQRHRDRHLRRAPPRSPHRESVAAGQRWRDGVRRHGRSPPWYFENRLTLGNTATVTAMTITIVVQRTAASPSTAANTVGSFTQSNTGNSNPAAITYTWTLTGQMGMGTAACSWPRPMGPARRIRRPATRGR